MKTHHLILLALACLTAFFSCKKDPAQLPATAEEAESFAAADRSAVTIPAGSVDALATALAQGQTVILAPGIHTETKPIVVSSFHIIMGQPGAVLRTTLAATTDYSVPLSVVFLFRNAANSMLLNLEMETTATYGPTAVVIESSPKVTVQGCRFKNFQYGVLIEKSDLASIFKNRVECSIGWQTGQLVEALGIVAINGEAVNIERNEVTGGIFGIWCCDKGGTCRRNTTHDNAIGIIMCKVPAGGFTWPGLPPVGAKNSGTSWTVSNNTSTGNFDNGIMVIDGASKNRIFSNTVHGNGLSPLAGTAADIETFSDSNLFGFPTPATHDNTIDATSDPLTTVRNCSYGNTITGGILWNGGCR